MSEKSQAALNVLSALLTFCVVILVMLIASRLPFLKRQLFLIAVVTAGVLSIVVYVLMSTILQ